MKVNNRYRLLTFIASVLAVCLLSTSADAQWWRWFRPRRPVPPVQGGDLIPAERLAIWTPGTYVGVPGGIPTNRTQCVTTECQAVTNAATEYKDGTTDARPMIQAAITSALANTYVLIPAGLWRMNAHLTMGQARDSITLRGAGQGVTTLDCRGVYCIYVGISTDANWNFPTSDNVITAFADDVGTGGTTLTIAATTSFATNQLVRVRVVNDLTIPVIAVNGSTYLRGQTSRLVSKTATTLTVFPPITGYSRFAGLSAKVNVATFQTDLVGIEDLTFDGENGTVIYGVWFEQTYANWMKNVTIANPSNYNVLVMNSLMCEIRHSLLDEGKSAGNNGAGLLMNTGTSCLIEDNVIRESFPNLEINSGSSNNVFGYNFTFNTSGLLGIDTNHNPHNTFNLYEGNVTHNLMSDGYFGGESETTVFRNLIHGHGIDGVSPIYCLSLKRFSRNFSFVGNVLGSAVHSNRCDDYGRPNIGNSSWTGEAQPSLGDFWADWNQTTTIHGQLTARPTNQTGTVTLSSGTLIMDQAPALWIVGAASQSTWAYVTSVAGNVYGVSTVAFGSNLPALDSLLDIHAGAGGFQELDLDVEATVIKKANWSQPSGIPAGEALSGGQTLADSLYRTSKPSWFFGLTWPPINPNSPTFSYDVIPAGYRHENAGADPPP